VSLDLLLGAEVSVWRLAGFIFFLRICDVSIGTLRTISVVNGRLRLSVVLGFFEILLWVTAISQVILRVREHPALMLAYAGGFAVGNAMGITLERKLALGRSVIRVISERGDAIADVLARFGHVLGVFESERSGIRTRLVFATLARRDLPRAVVEARTVDPGLFYVVERFSETSYLSPLPSATGWRAVLKRK
jgi:uncharacterized protein YebE (UPF0316 family)